MAQTAEDVGATRPHPFRLLPGGATPERHDVWAGVVLILALVVLIAFRRGLAGGSAGHLHVSAADGVVTVAYMVIGLAALRTLTTIAPDNPAAQSLAWIIGTN